MNDFILASRVRAALAKDALTSNLEVEVESHRGDILIKGDLCEQNEEVHRVAAAVPGVLTVSLRETVTEPEPALQA
jgi:osmotically-inducible protein OsmY